MSYWRGEVNRIQRFPEYHLIRQIRLLEIMRINWSKRALMIFPEIIGINLKEIQKGSGEKAFRPKALVVTSLAECVLSNHFPFLLKAYLIKIDL